MNLLLNIILVPRYGPIGAAWALGAAAAIRGIMALIAITRLFFGGPTGSEAAAEDTAPAA